MNKILINTPSKNNKLIDSFGRKIDYLRISVTDRCNFRCTYCMPENMKFLPKKDLLTFDEMDYLCSLFISRGITKIRLSGGEPLVRKGLIDFISNLSRFISSGDLEEIDDVTCGFEQNHTKKKQNGNELFVVTNTLIIFRAASSSVFTTSPYHQHATTTSKGITE